MSNLIDKSINSKFNKENSQWKKTFKSLISILEGTEELKDAFKYNLFTHDIVSQKDLTIAGAKIKKGKCLDDTDIVHIRAWLSIDFDYETGTNNISDGAEHVAGKCSYHPVRDWLDGITWDQQPRLDLWLQLAAGVKDDEYTRAVARKTLTAAVARIYEPGTKFDYMLILEGKQGIGKSTLCRVLGGDWFASLSLTDRDKDIIDCMRGAWIIENAELSSFKRENDMNWLNAFLSRETDRVRLSYAHRSKDYPRQSIFFGTYNPRGDNDYFRDPTGSRRYWPVECWEKDINLKWLRDNREQIFAEAKFRYEQKEPLYLAGQAEAMLAENIQLERMPHDSWSDMVEEYLSSKLNLNDSNDKVTVSEILTKSAIKMPASQINKGHETRIGIIMRGFKGWKRDQELKNDNLSRFYIHINNNTNTNINTNINKIVQPPEVDSEVVCDNWLE